ncbi:5562_t:CDS:2 [Diversispora eburnea]|uniref:5562_t:CDS:1 n=1 Tax=Diversispora eburnea TaxID=1213867 RepID=A0A9N8YNA2_9GLOM|nr:5562_t:CDS:2 [Diversispora eburnea]
MYSSESVESQRVRSVGSVNGRPSHRRAGSNSSAAASRLFINAVKDASRSSKGTEENMSDKAPYTKRPYSPSIDTFKDDQKTKTRRVENDSNTDMIWSRETDDKGSYMNHGSHSNDHEQYDPSSNEERGRFVNERRSSQSNSHTTRQSRSVLDRLGKKGGLMTAYINPAFFPNSNNGFDSQPNDNIALTPKVTRCRHWPNCDLGNACKFHHPTEICPQDFNSFENRNLFRFGSYGNGSNGQGNFGNRSNFVFDSIGNSFSHFGIGPSTSGPSGMGQGIFGQNSFVQNNYQHNLGGIDLYGATHIRQESVDNNVVQGSNFQGGMREKEQKSFTSGAGSANSNISNKATINTNASITATSSSTSNASVEQQQQPSSNQEKDSTMSTNSQSSTSAPAVLCKYGERCANPNCMYAHASPAAVGTGIASPSLLDVPCKFGLECTAAKCRYSHPSPANLIAPCKFYPNCKNPVCPYLHVDYSEPTTKVPTPCRNGAHCTRPNCVFLHPWDIEVDTNIPCRRPDCAYQHSMGKKDTSQTVSERTFVSVPDELTEKVYVDQDNKGEQSLDKNSETNVETQSAEVTTKEESNHNNGNNGDANSYQQGDTELNKEEFNWEEDLEDLEDINFILDDVDHGEVVTDV